jgi:hypothetical protein
MSAGCYLSNYNLETIDIKTVRREYGSW